MKAKRKRGSGDITIRFKDGKVHKVSGARNDAEHKNAVAFGEWFLKSSACPKTEPEKAES